MDLYGIVEDGVYLVIGGKVFSFTWAMINIGVLVLIIVIFIGRSFGSMIGFNTGLESGQRGGYERGHRDGWLQGNATNRGGEFRR